MDGDPRPETGLGKASPIHLPGHRLSASVSAAGGLHRHDSSPSITFELLSRCVYTRRRASACIPGSLRAALRGQSPALRLQYRQRAERSAEKSAAGDIDGKAV